jgi:hypothetical protein
MGLAPVLQSNKLDQTNAQLDRIEQALVVYSIQNRCLPCPASPTTLTGQANATSGDYLTPCSNAACALTLGPVPWVNLGLAKDDVIDAYGTLIDYAISQTPDPFYSAEEMKRIGGDYPGATIEVCNASGVTQTNATAVPTPRGAAYVLISHGPDRSGGFTPVGPNTNPLADPHGSALQSCNTSGGAVPACPAAPAACATAYVQDSARSGATYFDDIVRFKIAPILIQNCGADACGNPA